MEPASDADIETFLASHSVEAHAVEKLKSLEKKLAKAVISKGMLTDARDQTAVLISHCVEMQNLRQGDWVCQGCVHINWAKNTECKSAARRSQRCSDSALGHSCRRRLSLPDDPSISGMCRYAVCQLVSVATVKAAWHRAAQSARSWSALLAMAGHRCARLHGGTVSSRHQGPKL